MSDESWARTMLKSILHGLVKKQPKPEGHSPWPWHALSQLSTLPAGWNYAAKLSLQLWEMGNKCLHPHLPEDRLEQLDIPSPLPCSLHRSHSSMAQHYYPYLLSDRRLCGLLHFSGRKLRIRKIRYLEACLNLNTEIKWSWYNHLSASLSHPLLCSWIWAQKWFCFLFQVGVRQ